MGWVVLCRVGSRDGDGLGRRWLAGWLAIHHRLNIANYHRLVNSDLLSSLGLGGECHISFLLPDSSPEGLITHETFTAREEGGLHGSWELLLNLLVWHLKYIALLNLSFLSVQILDLPDSLTQLDQPTGAC